ncbi:GNAT family N-acetyltransferase [Leifsonia sp. AG29]|uniref:GNAT family N-acetyltransferase n=1 Tax=Leifsonia sp. AG29 TaxID=2598860 RepID=UPI00131C1A85|nr:GNAT family N-acetyltransferase [Leifsonia sp. AG29]
MALPPAAPVTLTGDRVMLSAPTEADVDRVTELCQEPAIAAWTTVPSPYARVDAESFITGPVAEGWATGRSCTWAIRRRERDGQLVGMVGLDAIHDAGAEVGYWLAPGARGAGLMSEAVSLVLDFGFAAPPRGLGLVRVEWHAFAGNAASASVARRAGFRFEGSSRLGGVQRGRRRDDWQAGLLASDPRVPADGWPADTLIQVAL